MRITSWNCHHGECRKRAAELAPLHADIVVLQECGRPALQDDQCIWFGTKATKGVGLAASGEWRLRAGTVDPEALNSAYPVEVLGPFPLHLLAVWAKPKPTYVAAIMEALVHYRNFLRSAPCMVVGDFNAIFDGTGSSLKASAALNNCLLREFGLVSASHVFAESSADQTQIPTHYWQWKKHQPYHLDYCFLPAAMVPRLQSVEIAPFDEWTSSDHRPLTVDLDLNP